VIKEYKDEQRRGTVKYGRKINRTFAYWSTKGILIGMFIKRMIRRALAVFDKQVESNTEIVRPERTSPRKKKPPRLYHMNYKDLLPPGPSSCHSDRKLLTGFLIAALMAWKLTVIMVMIKAPAPVAMNTHQGISVRY
jgi:hypothetical protein